PGRPSCVSSRPPVSFRRHEPLDDGRSTGTSHTLWARPAKRPHQPRADGDRGAVRDGAARRGVTVARPLQRPPHARRRAARAHRARRVGSVAWAGGALSGVGGLLRGGAAGGAVARRRNALERPTDAGGVLLGHARRATNRPRGEEPRAVRVGAASARARGGTRLLVVVSSDPA